MKTRDKVIILVCVFVCTLAIGGYIGTKYFLDKDIENSKKELEQVKKKYGSVEKESVATTVAKFNTQVMEKTNWKLLPVSDSNMVKHEKNYWFPIMEDISLVVMPDKYTGDKAKDISKRCMIHFPKDSKYKEQAMEYFKYLIFANNEKITEDEAKSLIDEAEQLKKDKKNANNGKGVFVGIYESDKYLQYQVVRSFE